MIQAAVWIFALPVALALWGLTRRRAPFASALAGCLAALVLLAVPLGIGAPAGSDDVEVRAEATVTTATPTTAATTVPPTTAPPPPPTAPPTTAPPPTSPPAPPTTAPPTTHPPAPVPTDRRAVAETLLLQIVVAPESAAGRYDRDLFRHWIDADGNDCNTRCEVLVRQELPGGGWYSMYDRVHVANSSDLDIDHVVPLAEAWRSGASTWDDARRREFANDLAEHALVAVTASSNRSKGDKDPSSWVPDHPDDWCDYAIWWSTVKHRWALTADPEEHTALRRLVDTC